MEYLQHHISNEKAVEEDGVDLMGYTPWGCIDLVKVQEPVRWISDMDSFMWINIMMEQETCLGKKDSFEWYKEVISTNGENIN